MLLDNLLSLLREEVDLYRSLLLIIEKESETIIKPRVDLLNEVNIEKECLVLRVRRTEERVVGILDRIARTMGVSASSLTLKFLSQSVEESYASQLRICRHRLIELVERIRTANEKNHQVITHSLGLIKESMSVLKGLLFPDRVYYSSGKFQEKERSGRIYSYNV